MICDYIDGEGNKTIQVVVTGNVKKEYEKEMAPETHLKGTKPTE